MDRLEEAKKVFDKEIIALQNTRDALDETYLRILDLVTNCEGKIVLTGMGKPGHIAAKLAATFASLGTPALKIHPAEAMHGDLGMISPSDVVIIISYSGETEEILRIIPGIRMIGAKIIGITGNANSTLAKIADVVQVLPKFEEACHLGLAPTSSTTSVLCYGDSLAVVASMVYGFAENDFGKLHPAGSLGKKLILKVRDLMAYGNENAVVDVDVSVKDAIIELSKKGLGAVTVRDNDNNILGIITDGDLRRQLEKGADVYALTVADIMSKNPKTVDKEELAVNALKILKKYNISCLLVTDGAKAVGTIRLQDIIGVGIVG